MTIDDILDDLRPGTEYGRRGEPSNRAEYEGMIIWRDSLTTRPDWSEIVTQLPVTRLRVAKIQKLDELRDESSRRHNENMGTNLPIKYLDDMIEWLTMLWMSIDAGSRNPRIKWTKSININTAYKNAILVINAFTVLSDVNNYDVVNDPGWPV